MSYKNQILALWIFVAFIAFQLLHWLVIPLGLEDARVNGEYLDVLIYDSVTYLFIALLCLYIRALVGNGDFFTQWFRRGLLTLTAGLFIQAGLRWTTISGRGFADIAIITGVYLIGAVFAIGREYVERIRHRKEVSNRYRRHRIGPGKKI